MNALRIKRSVVAIASMMSLSGVSLAAQPIPFDPDGAGPMAPVSVRTFDWMPGSALAVNGNPSGGLQVNNVVHLLSHGKLGTIVLADNTLLSAPAGTEFTFVTGFAEKVSYADGTFLVLDFDPLQTLPNYFEMWVDGPPDSAPLPGTGYNNGKRILYGVISSASGNYVGGAPLQALDQFLTNNYGGISTITGSGSTQLSGMVLAADPDYFPGLTPAMLNDFKVFFNTSSVTPFREVDPSANFVGAGAGWDGLSPPPANVAMNVGAINGGLQTGQTLNFVLQGDANQSFELGEDVPGACRVTYGGNDRNGNIAPGSFGQACGAKEKGKANCYTFGGQVGAPTANPALGGPFGEHTHHQVSGPAGDFVFRAGSRSAPKTTRITATACKDPGAIQPAAANASFKQIDFEGTGSFRTLSAEAKAYLIANGAPADIATDNTSDRIYYFRVDMVDAGEPGNKGKKPEVSACEAFLNADQNNPLATDDPRLLLTDGGYVKSGGSCADVYQFYVCPSELPCEQGQAMYAVRAFLTGGNIQLHKVIK